MILIYILVISLIFAAAITIFIKVSPQFGGKPDTESMQRILNSKNFKDGKFINRTDMPLFGKLKASTLKKMFKGGNRVPEKKLTAQKININGLSDFSDSIFSVFWLGHSSVLIKAIDKIILVDPVFGNRVSPVSFTGPKRFGEKALDAENLKYVDIIIITHDHYDHLDYKTIKLLKNKTSNFIVSLGVAAHLQRWGISKSKIFELDWFESVDISGIKFTSTPSQHFSGRGITNRNSTLWTSWVADFGNIKIFLGGDSGFDKNISKEIGEKFGPFDLTVLECGQYNEQWHHIHSFPEETVEAHLLLKGKYLLPVHWGAFSLSVHDWDEPVKRISKKAEELKINLLLPKAGEEIVLNKLDFK